MKNRIATRAAMMQTMTVVRPASLRVGQTTLAASERTWATNWAGLIIYALPSGHLGRGGGTRTPGPRFWRPMLYQLSYTPSAPPGRYGEKQEDARERGVYAAARPARMQ